MKYHLQWLLKENFDSYRNSTEPAPSVRIPFDAGATENSGAIWTDGAMAVLKVAFEFGVSINLIALALGRRCDSIMPAYVRHILAGKPNVIASGGTAKTYGHYGKRYDFTKSQAVNRAAFLRELAGTLTTHFPQFEKILSRVHSELAGYAVIETDLTKSTFNSEGQKGNHMTQKPSYHVKAVLFVDGKRADSLSFEQITDVRNKLLQKREDYAKHGEYPFAAAAIAEIDKGVQLLDTYLSGESCHLNR